MEASKEEFEPVEPGSEEPNCDELGCIVCVVLSIQVVVRLDGLLVTIELPSVVFIVLVVVCPDDKETPTELDSDLPVILGEGEEDPAIVEVVRGNGTFGQVAVTDP